MPLKRSDKRYSRDQSPLYALKGVGQFEKIIGVDWSSVDELVSQDNYCEFTKNGRLIQHPIGKLGLIHKRISSLLLRIELPDYVYSRKGRSHVDNATVHLGNTQLVKTDISKFYPSTTHGMVYNMFVDEFKCAKDISRRLADICCFRQEHLPTGSPLSGSIAFFSAKKMFDEINSLAERKNCRMSLYVDDVTVSGVFANKKMLNDVRSIIAKYGYSSADAKSKTYSISAAKVVTGVVVVGDELRLPNKQHRLIWEARNELANSSPDDVERIKKSLNGRICHANHVLGLNK